MIDMIENLFTVIWNAYIKKIWCVLFWALWKSLKSLLTDLSDMEDVVVRNNPRKILFKRHNVHRKAIMEKKGHGLVDFFWFFHCSKSFKMVHFAKKIGFNRNLGHSTLSWSHYFLVIFWRFSKMKSQLFSRICPLGYSIAILLLYIAYSNSTTTHTWPFTILMEN